MEIEESKNEAIREESLIPTAEELIPDPIEKRKNKIKNFLVGWIKDDYDKLFLLVLLTAFVLRILVYLKTQDQAIWWDAADYLATGKRWGLGLDTLDTWYYRRGFLWPVLEALFFRIGLGELSIRFFVVLLSTGIVFVTYFLISEMFNKKLALLTSIGVTFSWVFLFFTGRPLTNLPATFFFLAALLFFWKGYVKNQGKKYFILFGMFYAFACLIRMQYLMFVPSFLVMAILKEKWKFIKNKYLWYSILMFLIIFIPQFIIQSSKFGNPILDLATFYLGIGGSATGEVGVELAQFSNLFLYFKNLPYVLDANTQGYTNLFVISPLYISFIIGFFLLFIDLFLGFDRIFKDPEIQKRFFILFWIVSSFLFLGYIAPHLEQRYIMPVIPFLFFIAIYPFVFISSFLRKKFNIKTKTIVIIVSIILITVLVSNYKFGFSLIESKKTSYIEVKQAGEWIKANSDPDDIIIASSLPQLTYYTERHVYPFDLAYRRDISRETEETLDKFVLENRPKYFVISLYERDDPWAYTYPTDHNDILVPVQAFGPQDQPLVIVYRFDYTNIQSL